MPSYTPSPKKEPTASIIEGLDIVITEQHKTRIDRIVDVYETTILAHVEEEYNQQTRWADRVADGIARFGGSWSFILVFAAVLAAWITWNSVCTPALRFDPAPFILLNLCLSFLAAFQAPVIMMSQNRQATRDKREAIIDFALNYKAEQELDDMQGHLHRMEAKLEKLETLLIELKEARH